jgi:hypothetical protein
MPAPHVILGVHILNRTKEVAAVQSLLTDFGAWITTRLGLHRAESGGASLGGVLVLDMTDEEKCHQLAEKLDALDGVETQRMIFPHKA